MLLVLPVIFNIVRGEREPSRSHRPASLSEVEFAGYRATNQRKFLNLNSLSAFLCALQTGYSGLHVARLDPAPG